MLPPDKGRRMRQRIAAMGVVEDGVDVAGRAGPAGERRRRGDRAFAVGPAEVEHRRRGIGEVAGRDEVDLLGRVEPDVADVEVARLAVEARAIGIANAQRRRR